jgi:hypothetical protein
MSAAVEIGVEGLKVAPPVAVTGAVLMGMTPTEWITVLTLLYLVMSIGLLIPKYWVQIGEWAAKFKKKKG